MKTWCVIALVAVAVACGAFRASAQGGKKAAGAGQDRPRVARMMQEADKNGDGKVTYDELKAVLPKLTPERFKQMDRNGDGVLSKEDRPQGQDGPATGGEHGGLGQLLKSADANHDGKVTYDELKAVAPKMTQERFNSLDTNRDGVLTSDDKPAMDGGGNRAEMLKKADANHDGKISFDELKAVMPRLTKDRFEAMDTNHDGFLTADDRSKHGGQAGGKKASAALGAQADQVKKLLEVDANHDGKVTYEEVVAAKPGFPKETFSRYDTNGDGVLSSADLGAAR